MFTSNFLSLQENFFFYIHIILWLTNVSHNIDILISQVLPNFAKSDWKIKMHWSCFCHPDSLVHVDEVIKKYKNAKSILEAETGSTRVTWSGCNRDEFHPYLKMLKILFHSH